MSLCHTWCNLFGHGNFLLSTRINVTNYGLKGKRGQWDQQRRFQMLLVLNQPIWKLTQIWATSLVVMSSMVVACSKYLKIIFQSGDSNRLGGYMALYVWLCLCMPTYIPWCIHASVHTYTLCMYVILNTRIYKHVWCMYICHPPLVYLYTMKLWSPMEVYGMLFRVSFYKPRICFKKKHRTSSKNQVLEPTLFILLNIKSVFETRGHIS